MNSLFTNRRALLHEAVFLMAALIASCFFTQLRLRLCDPFAGPEMFERIAQHIGDKPWQYRILIPGIANGLNHLNVPGIDTLWGWAKGLEVLFMTLTVIAFRRYLSLLTHNTRLSAILSFLIFLILPFHFFFPRPYHPNYWYDTPSIFFFILGLVFLYERRWAAYYVLFAVATLNRETTCFLTMIYLFVALGRDKLGVVFSHCGAQFVIWLAIKLSLGKIYAGNPGADGFEWYDGSGLTHYADNLRFFMSPKNYPGFLSIMGYLWIPVVFYFPRIRDRFVRRSLWVIPPFFVGMFFVANIYELRIFAELIPVVLAAFFLIVIDLLRNPAQEE